VSTRELPDRPATDQATAIAKTRISGSHHHGSAGREHIDFEARALILRAAAIRVPLQQIVARPILDFDDPADPREHSSTGDHTGYDLARCCRTGPTIDDDRRAYPG
jgi:hypothetical protein